MSAKSKDPVIVSDTVEFPKFNEELGSELKSLCDRVCCNLNITLNSHRELAEFKQSVLDETIPPNVLVALSMTSGEIVKNGLDLQSLVLELVKIVRKNSYLLQEHMPKFVKLCDDYKHKCGQLDVAVRKLEMQNEKIKRIQHMEVLQNWEMLFTKVQVSKSHGRRWKYKIFDFKEKLKKGPESLKGYFQQLLDEDDGIVEAEPTEQIVEEKQPEVEVDQQEEEIKIEDLADEEMAELEDDEYQESFEDNEYESPEPVEMKDAIVSTSDVDYTQDLVLRIYNPKGLSMYGDLMCQVTYGNDLYKTGNLNKTIEAREEEEQIEKEYEESIAAQESSTKPKGGLIGKKKQKQPRVKTKEEIQRLRHERELRDLKRNEEIRIPIPASVTSGLNTDPMFNSMKFTLLSSPAEPSVGQITLDIEELLSRELNIHHEPVFRGDMISDDDENTAEAESSRPFVALKPMMFPVLQVDEQAGVSGIIIGELPIGLFWSRKEEPVAFHRAIETYPLNDLVEDLTGINLRLITKEELTREKIDEALSPRLNTPLPETVLKSDYEKMVHNYMKEIEDLDNTYKEKMEELQQRMVDQLDEHRQQMEQAQTQQREENQRPKTSDHLSRKSSSRKSTVYHQDCATSPLYPYRSLPALSRPKRGKSNEDTETVDDGKITNYQQKVTGSSKSRETLSTGGDEQDEILFEADLEEDNVEGSLSRTHFETPSSKSVQMKDFLERVADYSEISEKHQSKMRDKIKKEVSGAIEMKLVELSRLHEDMTEEDIEIAMADMSLPAIFMPFANASGTIFNPRAHQYFHPISLKHLRLSQAPSILKLPPIKENQMSVLNLFEIGTQLQITSLQQNMPAIKKKSTLSKHSIPIPPETTRVGMDDL